MLSLSLPVDIFLYAGPADLRKSYDSLSALVREHVERNVLDGGLFVFLKARRNRIKLLYWDRDGLAIWQKRLGQRPLHERRRRPTRLPGVCVAVGRQTLRPDRSQPGSGLVGGPAIGR